MSIDKLENKIDRLESKIDNLDGLKYDNLESKIDRLEIILNDIVNNLEDEEISIKLKDNSSPITAQENSNTKLVYVLMPMRV